MFFLYNELEPEGSCSLAYDTVKDRHYHALIKDQWLSCVLIVRISATIILYRSILTNVPSFLYATTTY
jgi:hypothetical protein